MELASNYAQIKEIVDQSPSLRSAYGEIARQGLVTVKYDAFARHWKRLAERKEQETQGLEALNAQSCADLPGAASTKKPNIPITCSSNDVNDERDNSTMRLAKSSTDRAATGRTDGYNTASARKSPLNSATSGPASFAQLMLANCRWMISRIARTPASPSSIWHSIGWKTPQLERKRRYRPSSTVPPGTQRRC